MDKQNGSTGKTKTQIGMTTLFIIEPKIAFKMPQKLRFFLVILSSKK